MFNSVKIMNLEHIFYTINELLVIKCTWPESNFLHDWYKRLISSFNALAALGIDA